MKIFKKILLTLGVFNILAILITIIFKYGEYSAFPEWLKIWTFWSISIPVLIGLCAIILFVLYLVLLVIWEK